MSTTVTKPTVGLLDAITATLLARLRRHPLLAFVILAFGGTWLIVLPLVLGQGGFGVIPLALPSDPLVGLSTFVGLTLSAFLLTAVTGGRAGVRELLGRYLRWRVGLGWYLLVLLGYPALVVAAASVTLGSSPVEVLAQLRPLVVPVILPSALRILVVGQLWEEVGWRGFALPRLQRRFGPVAASVLLGVLWGLWHLVGFFFPGGVAAGKAQLSLALVAQLVLSATILSVILTWLYNRTGGSLPIVILFHTVVNVTGQASARLLGAASGPYGEGSGSQALARASALSFLVLTACAVLLIALTRGRLAYQRPDDAPPAGAPAVVDRPSVHS